MSSVKVKYPLSFIKLNNPKCFVKFKELEVEHYFQPADCIWQNEPKKLTIPDKNRNKVVTSDGNGFYRALSFFIYGTENNHGALREIVVEVLLRVF